jgi:hypothetical protein
MYRWLIKYYASKAMSTALRYYLIEYDFIGPYN